MSRVLVTTLVLSLVTLATYVVAKSTGPPDARTGAPGESHCATSLCHGDFAVDSGSGILSLAAAPTYRPGETLTITIDLAQTGKKRWGFEATLLGGAGARAGTILVTDAAHTFLSTKATSGRHYIKHTSAGTYNNTFDASPGWSFQWTAPDPGVGPVTLYAAGNAANGNGARTGDHIYTTSLMIEDASTAVTRTTWGSIKVGYRDD